ncbi:Mitochondrial import inner membrane translocase subunit Tim9 [Platanthera zijinensis]|uniref:Mitochondrial import inner membrane translocase subunit Tim9 n=1 Tax=Platanthera zijinensis TaxID=2320716 RepID=A0AAP0G3X0_9ASPA
MLNRTAVRTPQPWPHLLTAGLVVAKGPRTLDLDKKALTMPLITNREAVTTAQTDDQSHRRFSFGATPEGLPPGCDALSAFLLLSDQPPQPGVTPVTLLATTRFPFCLVPATISHPFYFRHPHEPLQPPSSLCPPPPIISWHRLNTLRMYNSLVERCFDDCVDSFRRKTLDKQEETCVRRCAEKFLKHSMRVGMRFAELNQGAATQD